MSETLLLYYSDRFKEHETGSHPESAERMDAMANALREEDLSITWRSPRMATREELSLVHREEHIAKIESLAEKGGGYADPDTVVSPASFEIGSLSAGAGFAAVDSVCGGEGRRAFVVSRPPGHHALPQRAMGFCLFNNIALAARYAQTKYDVKNVMIVDFDVHHGNGTQDCFYEEASVFFLSTHQHPHYPGTGMKEERGKGEGEGYTMNLPYPPATEPETIVNAIQDHLGQIAATFRPELVLISAGFDGHEKDPLGNWLLREPHYQQITKIILDFAQTHCGGKIISFLEGGYNLTSLAESACAHARAMTGDS